MIKMKRCEGYYYLNNLMLIVNTLQVEWTLGFPYCIHTVLDTTYLIWSTNAAYLYRV